MNRGPQQNSSAPQHASASQPRTAAPPPAHRPRRTAVRASAALGLTLLVAVCVASVSPATLGLSEQAPFTQAVALRGLVAALALGPAVVLAALAWRWQGARRPLAVVAVVLAATGLFNVAVLGSRATQATAVTADPTLTVMTLNTAVGSTSPEDAARAIARTGAEVVALPETPAEWADTVVALLAAQDIEMTASTAVTGESPVGHTSLLMSKDLGDFSIDTPTGPAWDAFGTVTARSSDPSGLSVAAVHPRPPLPGLMPAWRQELTAAVARCGNGADIVMGDFNATIDHAPLRDLDGCTVASAATGSGATGTWPRMWPRALGAPIDHVLVDEDVWTAVSSRVLDVGDSDHRALVVELAPAG